MSDLTRSGWNSLEPEAISALGAKDFELLCYALVCCEAYERHADPDVAGPAGDYTADQGRDILLVVKEPPLEAKARFQQRYRTKPLTEDPLGRTVYSCKAGKSWLDDALRDARSESRGQRAVEVLKEGGHFKLLLGQRSQIDRKYKRDGMEATPQEHLVRALKARVGKKAAATLDRRVEILDAQKIRDFLVRVAPEGLLNEWGPRLGLVRMLGDIDAWRRAHQIDRQDVSFASDARREQLRGELLAFFEQPQPNLNARVARVLGPPGIGKTRLVLESLSSKPALGARLRFAQNSPEATEAFQRAFWSSHPEALLVVDDCSDDEVRGLVAAFAAQATNPRARLLLITPTKESAHPSPLRAWTVEPLAAEESRQLLDSAATKAIDEKTRASITTMAEGFPWFVILLVREVHQEGHGPRSMHEAVDWVLASRTEATGAMLAALRQNRARALLAVALTRSIDWGNLNEPEQDQLARAVGLPDWGQLKELAMQCHQRGLVRLHLGWYFKYVTPAVLEREIVRRLLGPDGPDPGGKGLFRFASHWAQPFFLRLPSLGLSPEVLRAIATSALEDLCALEQIEGPGALGLVGERLWLVASSFPASCARELRRLVSSAQDLTRFSAGREDVVEALGRVLLQPEGLQDAEATLFLLARTERGTHSNNAASTWANLFLTEYSFSPHPIGARWPLLCARLRSTSADDRLLALRGLKAVLAPPGFRLLPHGAGEPTSLPPELRKETRVKAWEHLGVLMGDPSEPVARAARTLALETLKGGGPPEVLEEALDRIRDGVETFIDQERLSLLRVLASQALSARQEDHLAEKLRRLRTRLTSGSFRDRLREQVGLWRSRSSGLEVTPEDEELASEALRTPGQIAPELAWLGSEEAVRKRPFAVALGQRDPSLTLLPSLLTLAPSASSRALVVAYFTGQKASLSRPRFQNALRRLRETPGALPVFAVVASSLGLHKKDALAIAGAIRDGQIDDEVAAEVAQCLTVTDLALEGLREILDALGARGAPASTGAALGTVAMRWKVTPAVLSELGPQVDLLLMRYPEGKGTVMGDHDWEQLALARLEQGSPVVPAAALALLVGEGSPEPGWQVLHRAATRDPKGVWRALASHLERDGSASTGLRYAFHFHGQEIPLPTQEVLSWVGEEEHRGRAVAALIPPFQAPLPELLRRLLVRFGPASAVAREISLRMQTTTQPVPSVASHFASRLAVARSWLKDEEANVQTFARKLVRVLEERRAYHEASEEAARLKYGS
jgi:hypothetical protein